VSFRPRSTSTLARRLGEEEQEKDYDEAVADLLGCVGGEGNEEGTQERRI